VAAAVLGIINAILGKSGSENNFSAGEPVHGEPVQGEPVPGNRPRPTLKLTC